MPECLLRRGKRWPVESGNAQESGVTGVEMRTIRKLECRMTQAEFASAIGVTPQFVGMMERCERDVSKTVALAAEWVAYQVSNQLGQWSERRKAA
jgi:DNA-binding XRE family transcriptional regulator